MSNVTPAGVQLAQVASPIANARAQNIGADLELAANRGLGNDWVTVLRLESWDVPTAEEVCTVYVRAVAVSGEPMPNLRGRATWGAGGSRGGNLLFDVGTGSAFSVPTGAVTVDVQRIGAPDAQVAARVSAFIARGNHGGELYHSTPFGGAPGPSDIPIPLGAVRAYLWTTTGIAPLTQYLDAAGTVIGQLVMPSGWSLASHLPPQARTLRVLGPLSGTVSFRLLK